MTTKTTSDLKRDGQLKSAWQHGLPETVATDTTLEENKMYDCLVIGGGITGITTALLLQKAGKAVVVAEAYNVGFGTTGGTSAHINNFADTTYKEAESAFGKEGAQLFADAIQEGYTLIKENVAQYHIDCDYETKTGYLFAEDDEQEKQLTSVYDGLVQVGISTEYVKDIPVNIPFKAALKLPNQAQFHPLKYVQALTREYMAAGGDLLENTRIDNIVSNNGAHAAESATRIIKAKKVIYATHIPPGLNVFNLECAAYRSYIIVAKLADDQYPDGMIYDLEDPYHYIRTHFIDNEPFLLVGGNDHKTGHEDPEKVFDDLEKYVRRYFKVSSVRYRWSSQYYIPVDGLPYIGQMPLTAKGVFCATGFNGNGMMFGSVAAKILSDLALEKESPKDLFDPSRLKPIDSFTDFVTENADVAYHFAADRFNFQETDSFKELAPGTGKLLEIDGKKVAAYKDTFGAVHALNPTCTHMKCTVNWNPEETSWDCPCHGARFDVNGKILTGPAQKNLEIITEAAGSNK